ncbi:MAG: ASCH domain-containing protein [Dysgonamonadaceae bacterium]|jgi:predicted transcriptional regulator|nr:ASCH domain-containing protein [Dysgonamonadaceae bacterium]
MKVLLSIKPEFALKIFEGTKKYEFRKIIFKRKDVTTVVVYASSPMQQVIGEFEIEKILCKDTESLWQETKRHSGITKDFYDEYFADKEMAYAIQVGATLMYTDPLLLADVGLNFAPQSFAYL